MKQRRIDIPRKSDRVEWKESLGEWKEIVETCAAFATARGGTIYVGVAPHGTTNGIEIGKGTLEDLSNNKTEPRLQNPIKDPARLEWHEVRKVDHYWLAIDAVTQPMQVRENETPYGERKK